MPMKTERIRAEVYVTLRYDTPEMRKEALQKLRSSLGLYTDSIGTEGRYTVKTGRVIAPKAPASAT